jgi:hypothetical protein
MERWHRLERRRFLVKVAYVGVKHICNTGTHGIEGFERTHQGANRKHLDFDTPTRRDPNRLREADRIGVKSRRVRLPVGDHFELPDSLRDRGRWEGHTRYGS